MSERCAGDVIFSATAAVADFAPVFPDAVELYTQGAMRAVTQDGVYILNLVSHRQVGIKGKCPNFQDGGCTFGAPCPIKALINKK